MVIWYMVMVMCERKIPTRQAFAIRNWNLCWVAEPEPSQKERRSHTTCSVPIRTPKGFALISSIIGNKKVCTWYKDQTWTCTGSSHHGPAAQMLVAREPLWNMQFELGLFTIYTLNFLYTSIYRVWTRQLVTIRTRSSRSWSATQVRHKNLFHHDDCRQSKKQVISSQFLLGFF